MPTPGQSMLLKLDLGVQRSRLRSRQKISKATGEYSVSSCSINFTRRRGGMVNGILMWTLKQIYLYYKMESSICVKLKLKIPNATKIPSFRRASSHCSCPPLLRCLSIKFGGKLIYTIKSEVEAREFLYPYHFRHSALP